MERPLRLTLLNLDIDRSVAGVGPGHEDLGIGSGELNFNGTQKCIVTNRLLATGELDLAGGVVGVLAPGKGLLVGERGAGELAFVLGIADLGAIGKWQAIRVKPQFFPQDKTDSAYRQ